MTPEDEKIRRPFAEWLARRWEDVRSVEVGDFEPPKSGFSAKTVFVPVRYERGGRRVEEKVVLRLENPEPAIYPQQAPGLDIEIEIQYRAMEQLIATGKVPLAPLIGYEADASLLGAPFFAMAFVAGDVMVEDPPYTLAGFFTELSPAGRRAVISEGLRVLASFHTIDWKEAGFDWLLAPGEAPTVERQIDLWEAYARRELGERVHPDLDRGLAWLRRYLPGDLEPGLSWGDSRPGNFIFRDQRCLCITDFENIAIAPTEIDLGWWLMFDRTQHECVGAERLPGEPTRQEQREIYAEHAGCAVPETRYFEVLAAVRYAAIVVRVMNRLVARGTIPEDNPIWLTNPASDALARILAEV
jgi:aminoglycoside phosphotransferase (APT) family kinase protein